MDFAFHSPTVMWWRRRTLGNSQPVPHLVGGRARQSVYSSSTEPTSALQSVSNEDLLPRIVLVNPHLVVLPKALVTLWFLWSTVVVTCLSNTSLKRSCSYSQNPNSWKLRARKFQIEICLHWTCKTDDVYCTEEIQGVVVTTTAKKVHSTSRAILPSSFGCSCWPHD
jgi:hypothetical protein